MGYSGEVTTSKRHGLVERKDTARLGQPHY